jgi:calcium-translocating P-type ATPase
MTMSRLAADATAVGLTSAEAHALLIRHGPNALPEPARPSRARRLGAQLRSPMVGLLGLAAALSIALGDALDAGVILVVVVMNALLGYIQEARADRAAVSLRELLRPRAVVERDGAPREIDARDLVQGDVVVLDAGDRVPADGRIDHARSFELDESMLTGESLPVARERGELLAGTTVTRGVARMVVTATGPRTQLAQIAAAATRPRQATPLEERLGRLAGTLLRAGAGVCLLFGMVAWAEGTAPGDAALIGIALAVAAIPEGLPAIVSITLALGVRAMARRGAIVRRLHAVETLGSATVICADKTGTLTQNRMTVTRILDRDGCETSVADCVHPSEAARDALLAAAIACETPLNQPATATTTEPTEAAVLEAAAAWGLDRAAVRVVCLEPFDAERRRVSALVEDDRGARAVYVKGASDGLTQSLDDVGQAAQLDATAARWASEGVRVLLVARGQESRPLEALGLLGLSDPPREGVAADVSVAHAAGVRTVMVTGDHAATGLAVARRLGIADCEDRPLIGADIDALSDAELAPRARDVKVVARVLPHHKLRLVEALRADGEVVAMTGDGVNDAPALRAADIGIAMGLRGSDAAKEAADMVLADDQFRTIVHAIERGRAIYENVARAVHFLLSANAGEVATFGLALAAGVGPPLTVLPLLLMNLLTDALPAVALAADRPAPDVMRRSPRPRAESLLAPIRGRVIAAGLTAGAAGFTSYLVGHAQNSETGRTMAFATLVFAQLAYVYSVRGVTPAWRAGRNPWLNLAVASSALVATVILAVPALARAFDLTAISAGETGLALALAFLPLAVGEIAKAISRRRTA